MTNKQLKKQLLKLDKSTLSRILVLADFVFLDLDKAFKEIQKNKEDSLNLQSILNEANTKELIRIFKLASMK